MPVLIGGVVMTSGVVVTVTVSVTGAGVMVVVPIVTLGQQRQAEA